MMFRSVLPKLSTGAICLSLAVTCLPGCGTNPPTGGAGAGDEMPQTRTLAVEFDGLEALGEEFVYEGWLIVGDMPVSTGRFEVDADGQPDPAEFDVQAADADAATTFVLTIEPAVGDDPAPADTHVLAGDFDGGVADLGIGHPAARGQSDSLCRNPLAITFASGQPFA